MSWLYVQTWLWYFIAFVIGVLLAWAFLVVPQQRRPRGSESGAADRDLDTGGRRDAAEHDRGDDDGDRSRSAGLAAAGAGAAASGTALFHSEPATDPGSSAATADRGDPVTEQLPAVEPALSNLDTTELPVQTTSDDSSTAEIPIVPAAEPATGLEPSRPVDGNAADGVDGSVNGTASSAEAPGPDSAATTTDGTTTEGATTTTGTATAATHSASGSSAGDPEAATAPAPSPDPATDITEPTDPDPDPEPADTTPDDRPQGLLGAPAAAAGTAAAAGAYPGSARPSANGAAPSPGFTIKGNEDSMLFHTPESPHYGRTKAEVWFASTEDAEAAGFTSWTRKN